VLKGLEEGKGYGYLDDEEKINARWLGPTQKKGEKTREKN